jgi:type I restriction enzyme S subunit
MWQKFWKPDMTAKTKWPTRRLGDLAEFRNGVNYNKSSFGEGMKVVGVSDFQDYTKPRYAELDQINPDGIVSGRNILHHGDIVFVRSNGNRELIGRSLFIQEPPEEVTHSAFTIRLRFKSREVDPKFYAYCFRTPLVRKGLTAHGGGTNISNLNQDILGALEVPFPPLRVQQRIASVLSSYDELIENSRRRIQILEKTTRTVYREWFVYFRFPGHRELNHTASSVGDIPPGWKIAILRNLTTKIGSGATPRGGKEAYHREGIALIRSLNIYDYQFEFSNLAYIDDEQAEQLDNVVVERCDVLLNITGASVARCSMVPSYILPARVNQHVAIIRADPQRMNPYYLLDTINNDQNKQKLLGLAQGGATREALTKDTISNLPILLPPQELVSRYGEVAGPLHTQREILNRQIQNLRRTRDLLLPRLLSGQVNLEAN